MSMCHALCLDMLFQIKNNFICCVNQNRVILDARTGKSRLRKIRKFSENSLRIWVVLFFSIRDLIFYKNYQNIWKIHQNVSLLKRTWNWLFQKIFYFTCRSLQKSGFFSQKKGLLTKPNTISDRVKEGLSSHALISASEFFTKNDIFWGGSLKPLVDVFEFLVRNMVSFKF